MIISLVAVGLAYLWLLRETRGLTIRLLIGRPFPLIIDESDIYDEVTDLDLLMEQPCFEIQDMPYVKPGRYNNPDIDYPEYNRMAKQEAQDRKRALYHDAMLYHRQLRNF